MIYSYSKISTFKKCPLQFKYAYIDNIKVPIPSNIKRGEYMHTILENVGKDVSYENFEYIMNSVIPPLELSEKEIESAKKSLYKWFSLARFGNIVDVEKTFSININEYIITGRIDRIDRINNTYSIVDYKTGYVNYNDLQLNIYAIAAYQLYTADEIIIKYLYLCQYINFL
jgi:RecB family exonuclease